MARDISNANSFQHGLRATQTCTVQSRRANLNEPCCPGRTLPQPDWDRPAIGWMVTPDREPVGRQQRLVSRGDVKLLTVTLPGSQRRRLVGDDPFRLPVTTTFDRV